jgi:hypothetical protein
MCVTHTLGHAHVLRVSLGQNVRSAQQDTSTIRSANDAHAVIPGPQMMYVIRPLESASAPTNTPESVVTIANLDISDSQSAKNANVPNLVAIARNVTPVPADASAIPTTWEKTVVNVL